MKDLDFDELDKAVNSLMAGVPKTPSPADDAGKEKTVTIDSSQPSSPASSAMPLPVPSSSPRSSSPSSRPSASRSTPQAAPATRRAGRFMDVVHPSSDMKKPEPARPVSREGTVIEPAVSKNETAPAVETPAEKAVAHEEPVAASHSDWPDPLEMANFDDKKAEISKPVEASKETETETPQTTDENDSDTPLVSPFLPDTKVEKRPLGANASAVADETETMVAPSDEQLPATADDIKPILPEELHSDLVAIESDTTEVKPEEPEKETGVKPEPEKEKPVWNKPSEESELPKEKAVPTGPGSIPQQYKEEPSSGTEGNGAIYDTANYHQPLTHPAKQKSGWMWVVWILLILVIGAGIGAAAYFLNFI